MKSSKQVVAHEQKHNEISVGDLSRVKLPHLPKSGLKSKRPQCRVSSRLASTPTKYEQLVDEILDLQNCVSKKYGKAIRIDSLRKMQKSVYSLNQDLLMINRNTCIKSAKEAVRSTSSSDYDGKTSPNDHLSKWSKRILLKPRPEMKEKNLVVVNFEGVLGEVYKDNIWNDKESKLHLRKGCVKGLQLLNQNFQVALFFNNKKSCYQKVIKYFISKKLKFDAIYVSENEVKWGRKNSEKVKRPMKYSEYIQDYTQVARDFSIDGDELGRMLILTSIWLESNETGAKMVVRNFHSITQYFCKAVPVLKDRDSLLPITLAVADPRVSGDGDSFLSISGLFSSGNEEPSWIDSFARIREEPQHHCIAFETSAYQFALIKDKIKPIIPLASLSTITEPGHCICQSDLKPMCKYLNHGKCTIRHKLKPYKLANKDYPLSLLKNKFIILKPTKPIPYKTIQSFKSI